jgi:mono/diheme cytochrome c family protein
MFRYLSKIISLIFIFLFAVTFIIFGTIYLIFDQQVVTPAAATAQVVTVAPPVELTETAASGKAIFKTNCAACHKMYKKAVGPALHNVAEKYEREWLYAWIKNSAALIASGDSQAIAVYEEYGQSNMNAFPQLTNEDIDNILEYTSIPKP